MRTVYDSTFFAKRQKRSLRSARQIIPIIIEQFRPKSVIDLGCANGTWLSVFRDHGVGDVMGVDGPWVDRETLMIPQDKFIECELTRDFPSMSRRFELAISIEVAEHLPPSRAEAFVGYITSLADVIVFSAAIPGQGGDGHVNEQWQSYWADLFLRREYMVSDSIRPLVWRNPSVDVVHAQNILVYRRNLAVGAAGSIDPARVGEPLVDIVHPRLFAAHRRSVQPQDLRARLLQKLAGIFDKQRKAPPNGSV